MCVILLCQENRPSEEMIEKAYNRNSDGAGLAWREGDEVVWKKGLNVAQITDLAMTVPLPYVLHFRIASVGGVHPALTHPFPIEEEDDLALEGRTRGHVIFHNGHWGDWEKVLFQTAMLAKVKLPRRGLWSDTRALTWSTRYYGFGLLDKVDERVVAFGPGENETEVFKPSGWKEIEDPVTKQKFWASNDHFLETTRNFYGQQHNVGKMCRAISCTRQGNLDQDGRCFEHPLHPRALPAVITNPQPNPTQPVTGPVGGVQTQIPFVETLTEAEMRHPTHSTLSKADRLQKKGVISKNALKRLRKKFWSAVEKEARKVSSHTTTRLMH